MIDFGSTHGDKDIVILDEVDQIALETLIKVTPSTVVTAKQTITKYTLTQRTQQLAKYKRVFGFTRSKQYNTDDAL